MLAAIAGSLTCNFTFVWGGVMGKAARQSFLKSIRSDLRDGWGVEDIALRLDVDVILVRQAVHVIVRSGEIYDINRDLRARIVREAQLRVV